MSVIMCETRLQRQHTDASNHELDFLLKKLRWWEVIIPTIRDFWTAPVVIISNKLRDGQSRTIVE